jgi:DNA polymerase I-like protein with 3'-5' exonuclease and polymerase domains
VEVGKACYIPVAHRTGEEQLERDWVLAQMKPWLEDPLAKKLGQNLKYDMHVFGNYQIQVQGVEHDTLLESYVLESHLSHSMDNLAQRHLGVKTIQYEEVCGKGVHQIGFDQVDLKTATEYAAEDADITLRLHHHLWPQLERMPSLRYVYEFRGKRLEKNSSSSKRRSINLRVSLLISNLPNRLVKFYLGNCNSPSLRKLLQGRHRPMKRSYKNWPRTFPYQRGFWITVVWQN